MKFFAQIPDNAKQSCKWSAYCYRAYRMLCNMNTKRFISTLKLALRWAVPCSSSLTEGYCMYFTVLLLTCSSLNYYLSFILDSSVFMSKLWLAHSAILLCRTLTLFLSSSLFFCSLKCVLWALIRRWSFIVGQACCCINSVRSSCIFVIFIHLSFLCLFQFLCRLRHVVEIIYILFIGYCHYCWLLPLVFCNSASTVIPSRHTFPLTGLF